MEAVCLRKQTSCWSISKYNVNNMYMFRRYLVSITIVTIILVILQITKSYYQSQCR